MPGLSRAQTLARLPRNLRVAWVKSLDARVLAEVRRREWWFIRRPEQALPGGDWRIWLILAGRGFGKTRTGAETLTDWMLANPVDVDGHPTEWLCVGATLEDCRALMAGGPSGIVNVLKRRGIRHRYVATPRPRITLADGQQVHFQAARDGDVGRGLNLAGAWLDEMAKWPHADDSWKEGISPALRVRVPSGDRPRVIITTTPKPMKILVDFAGRADGSVALTRGSTFDNAANLSEDALAELVKQYGNSRTGRQELYGELLTEVEGALWKQKWINDQRVDETPDLRYVVVAFDPAVSDSPEADESGIVGVGRDYDGEDYVLRDRSDRIVGEAAVKQVWACWLELDADVVVYEDNQGMEWVREALQRGWDDLHREDPAVWPGGPAPVKGVHAVRGKRLRAEPVALRYELRRVHHLGDFPILEDQLTTWLPSSGLSPDRLDALVHGMQELQQGEPQESELRTPTEVAGVRPVDPTEHTIQRMSGGRTAMRSRPPSGDVG